MKFKLTNEELQLVALKYTNRTDFQKNDSSAYGSASYRGILSQICSHMGRSKTKPLTTEEIVQRAKKFNTRMDFRVGDQTAYKGAIKFGILNEVCSHMEFPKTALIPLEKLKQEALKFKTRGEFHDLGKNTYETARMRGVLDEICSHMPEHVEMTGENSPLIKYSLEVIHEEALKYSTRSEFSEKNVNMYIVAQRRGFLDIVCAHMGKAGDTSRSEKELFSIIKEKYPSAKKLRDMKVKIKNKSYIKGFDIDIFVKELNLGIEFDGTYWHSFEGLKKSRKDKGWSDEDIHNYHEIKDSWFLSKGIKILHIKEAEWLENKQNCIEKCFNFLGL